MQWPAEPGKVGERREGAPDPPTHTHTHKEPTEAASEPASESAPEEEASLTRHRQRSYHHLLLPYSGLAWKTPTHTVAPLTLPAARTAEGGEAVLASQKPQ